MKLTLLRYVLMIDAAVLLLIGALFILVPSKIEVAFHFNGLPEAVGYLIGLWGCVFATLGFGYTIAATNPVRHIAWVQMGIARGGLELILGLVYITRGVVTWQQASFGVITAGLITLAYALLYPCHRAALPEGASQGAH